MNLRHVPARWAPLVGLMLVLGVGPALADPSGSPPVPDAGRASGDWWDAARQEILDAEYRPSWQVLPHGAGDGGWQAPNRAHGFRTWFLESGVRVEPRVPGPGEWNWGSALIAVGRPGAGRAPLAAAPSADAAGVRYDRGAVVEWYANDRAGLEQGFDLFDPPAPDAGGPVVLTLRLSGDLLPRLATDGRAIDFLTIAGAPVLRYGKLLVRDATGTELPATMALTVEEGDRLVLLVFDDTEAVYPVQVDPLLTAPAWTAEIDQSDAGFGTSVAAAGDVNGDGFGDVIVGAPDWDNGQAGEGGAFVYFGSPSGPSVVPDWTGEADVSFTSFGVSVAGAGDVNGDGYSDLLVGASGFTAGEADEGRLYVYHGSPTGPSATADWTVQSNLADAHLGNAVSSAGDVNGDGYSDVIAGAHQYGDGQVDEGAAFVYAGGPGGLATTPLWQYESDQVEAFAGQSVGLAGDVNGDGYGDLLVGVFLYDGTHEDGGRVLAFHGSAAGPSAVPDWTAEGSQIEALLGFAVGPAGDVNGDGYADVVASARRFDNGELNEGAAYLYVGSAAGLAASPLWSVEGNQIEAFLGTSVGTAGDVNGDGYADLLVGSNLFNSGQQQDVGVVRAYYGSPGGPSAQEDWSVGSGQPSSEFGFAAATAGDVNGDGFSDVIVGARRFDNVQFDEGRVFLYYGSASGPETSPGWTSEGDQDDARFSFAVSSAGDVDGDGFSDVIVGAPGFDNGEADEGAVFVFRGSPAGPSTVADWTADGGQAGAGLGASVASAGDVDGDGYDDILAGADLYDGGEMDEGAAFLWPGSATGPSAGFTWSVEGDQIDARLGASVSSAGDVDGDGLADVIVGAPGFSNGEVEEGRASVYLGDPAGPSVTAMWEVESNQNQGALGSAVASAGDVDGDGFSDVLVGVPGFNNGQVDEGIAVLYRGSEAGPSTSIHWFGEGDQTSASFGRAVASAGDVDGDGFSDILVGAPYRDTGVQAAGRASLYRGSPAGPSTAADWVVDGSHGGALFGWSVGGAGDVNGDGFADVIVGAIGLTNGESGEGAAFVYLGSGTGPGTSASWMVEGQQLMAEMGSSVASAGDVNGDGYADVIVGARYFNNGQSDEGGAFLYLGNDGGGPGPVPQQRRVDDSAPIGPQGVSDSLDGFRLAALGRTPFGRGPVKLEWEVKRLGTPFDGIATGRSADWLDSGLDGAALSDAIDGLEGGATFHWRLRVLYHPAVFPFQRASRWFTVPRNGWEELDLSTSGCRDFDGDGYGQLGNATCPAGTALDCDDGNDLCNTDCTDADGDGYCVTTDCDDGVFDCTTDCSDADMDGVRACDGDCNNGNPNCTTDCTDADGDGYCVTTDCDDSNSNCDVDCTDVDGDGFCVTSDCDDDTFDCNVDCRDNDMDGIRACEGDCNDQEPFCSSDCTDDDGDAYCVTHDCDDANPNCNADCTDADVDGYCVTHDCDDAEGSCNVDCTDADGDGFCVTTDCDDSSGATFPGAAPQDDPVACMRDVDGDGWGDASPPGGVVAGTDCDDLDEDAFPGAAPQDDPLACMRDADGDDWGDATPPAGVTPGSDCDDAAPAVNPASSEVCTDGIDNDCDGDSDAADGDCMGLDVGNLRFTSQDTMEWDPAVSADAYALYRGDVGRSGFDGYDHLCEAAELSGPLAVDRDVPRIGEGYYYLPTGALVEPGSGGKIVVGSLGVDSFGGRRQDSTGITCGARVYVDPDAVGSGLDGLSWATAYTRVSTALEHPRAAARGLEIWARGSFSEQTTTVDGADRPGVRLLGGFEGDETQPWQRDPEAHPTTWTGFNTFTFQAKDADLVIDGIDFVGGSHPVLVEGSGSRIELVDVSSTARTGYLLRLTATGGAGELIVRGLDDDGSGFGGVRAVVQAGELTGFIEDSTLAGGSDAALRLEARAQGADATMDLDLERLRIEGGGTGVVLGAHVVDQSVVATQASSLESSVIHGTAGDGVLVEAGGSFSSEPGPAAALAVPTVVGSTISDCGGAGVRVSAVRSDSTATPSMHEVRAVPELWDNLITFHAGAGIEESSDDPPSNLVADPVVVGNGLAGNAPLYLDEGGDPLTTVAEVDALAEADDSFDGDPLYVDRPGGDYRLQAGTSVVAGFGGSMRYLANSTDPMIGMDWTMPGFPDGGWSNGLYGVGYDEIVAGPSAQELILTTVPVNTASVYTRVEFTVEDPNQVRSVLLGLDWDDGVAAWINGVEIHRSPEMPAGALDWNADPALHESSNAGAPVYDQFDVSAEAIPALVSGTNVLAIGVWNHLVPASSDLVVVPRLVLNPEDSPAVDIGHTEAPRSVRLDLDGEARVKDANGDGTAVPDIGADER